MTDIDRERDEYRDIKDWLGGRKRSAQGRVWRRRMQVQIQKALPAPLRRVSYAMAPGAGFRVMRKAFGILIVNMSIPLVHGLVSIQPVDGLHPVQAMPLDQMAEGLMLMLETVRPFVNVLGACLIALDGVAWFIAGD